MTIREELDRAAPVVDRLNDAIRENPLAAGLIGAGVAWMLFGGKGLGVKGLGVKGLGAIGGVANMIGEAGGKVASAAMSAGSVAAGASSAASAAVKDAASGAIGSVGSIVPDAPELDADRATSAVAEAGTAVGERFQSIATSGREYSAVLQSRLSESLEQQPLLLGAIGLAIGAGIASTFATTKIESEWMGEKGAAARDALQGAADQAKDRARQVVSDVQEEASRQGLTTEGAKDAAASVADKVKNVGGSARVAVTQPFTKAR